MRLSLQGDQLEFFMNRTMIGAGIGTVCGVLLLAGLGAWQGYTDGIGRRLPPGWEAAVTDAFVYTAYFWWLAVGVGGFIGGCAGLGSWLVRPRQPKVLDY